jgi:hypothetical protein
LLELNDNNVLTIVFDLNAEYLNLRKANESTPSQCADQPITFTPYLAEESDFERVLMIPIHEITHDDFAAFVNVLRESAMFLYLIQFWRQSSDIAFTLDDLQRFVESIENEFARAGLLVHVEVARASELFGPNAVTGFIRDAERRRGDHLQSLGNPSLGANDRGGSN